MTFFPSNVEDVSFNGPLNFYEATVISKNYYQLYELKKWIISMCSYLLTISMCPIPEGVNPDYVIKVESARLLHWLLFSFL